MSSNQSWPDLVGKPVDEAVAAIKSENPSLNVIPLEEGSAVTKDLRWDRVRVFFDANNQVSSVPRTG
ncbi:unnamed protein product [Rotaria sordida]|uniref:Uncharacterized protein n=1 Tax=Rotaria sordida TaxID=392033 RepID=A0A819ITU8_9BILA|nr:unnamed protein product [Rotaria sordida]CAF3922798.1 unnamed protein product [Rotaria sordida]